MATLNQPASSHYPTTYSSFPSSNSLFSPPQVTTYEGFYAKFEGRSALGEARWPAPTGTSSDDSIIPTNGIRIAVGADDAFTVTFYARAPGTANVTLSGATMIARVRVVVKHRDTNYTKSGSAPLVLRLESGFVLTASGLPNVYKMPSALIPAGTPRADILSRAGKAGHLVFNCHAKDPFVMDIGEGFKYPGRDSAGTAVASPFGAVAGKFKVIWMTQCAAANDGPWLGKDFMRAVAKQAKCWVIGSSTSVLIVSGLSSKELDMPPNTYCCSPDGSSVSAEQDFLRDRKKHGFSISKYMQKDVDDKWW